MSDIREKIKNLLDLAQSDNEHEAKAALLKAQELMVKHKLSDKDIDGIKDQKVKTINTGIKYSTQRDSHILSLSSIIAENYCCVRYVNRNYGAKLRTVMISGLEEDVDICHQVLQKAVETIQKNSKKLVYRKGYSASEKRIVMKSYAKGFVEGLDEMFRLQRKSNEEEWGLVLVVPQEVKDVLKGMKNNKFNVRNNGFNHASYEKGQKDGKNFSLEKTHGIGNTKLRICG